MKYKAEEVKFIKSPLNYVGGKYKLLPQILPLFPKKIDTFVDLFGGGFNVGINVNANNIIYNDHIKDLVDMFEEMAKYSPEDILKRIKATIEFYRLSKQNEQGFKQLRSFYNLHKNPLDLYVLASYSFNYQLRFNNSFGYNSSFGRNRSDFNINMEKRLLEFLSKIQQKEIVFLNKDFSFIKNISLSNNDLVYVDCPYLITSASYNDGTRGFGDWKEKDERELLYCLDGLNKNNIRFAISNVFENKGKKNDILIEWASNYNIHFLENTYGNCSYNAKDKTMNTSIEVLVTNY